MTGMNNARRGYSERDCLKQNLSPARKRELVCRSAGPIIGSGRLKPIAPNRAVFLNFLSK